MLQEPLNTTKWTVVDYHRMIAAGILKGRSVELLDGVIVDMAPMGSPHAAYSQAFADHLRTLLGSKVRIRENKPVTLSGNSQPEPDIAVVFPHPVKVYVQHHPYPGDVFWLIEYSDSSLSEDLQVKSLIYASAGIPEYWVINLSAKEVVVFRDPENGTYQSHQIVSQGSLTPIAFPEVSISLDQIVS